MDVNILKSKELKIEKNVIEMDDSIIQISNVTSVSLRYPPKYTNNNATIVGLILGFLLLFGGGKYSLVGIFLLGICGYLIYRVWEKNQDLGKNIIIATGGGGYFWINSKDDSFSLKVIDVIRNLMNDPNKNSDILINLEKLNIMNNGNLIYGNTGDSSININSGNYANNENTSIHTDDNHKDEDECPELRI